MAGVCAADDDEDDAVVNAVGEPTEDADVGAGELAADEGEEDDVVVLPLRLSPLSCNEKKRKRFKLQEGGLV